MGPTELCINISQQTWAFILPPEKDFWTLLRLFTDLSFYENHVNTTETLRKGQKTLCKGFTYKNFFIIGDWNAKVGSQETPGETGRFGLGIRNEAGQSLIEF